VPAPGGRWGAAQVMFESPEDAPMPRSKLRPTLEEVKALLAEGPGLPAAAGAGGPAPAARGRDDRGARRREGRADAAAARPRRGTNVCTLVTRVGKLELRVPQDRQGRFSTELFERYQRSEKALVAVLAEMYVQASRPGR
jgi:putative transposase